MLPREQRALASVALHGDRGGDGGWKLLEMASAMKTLRVLVGDLCREWVDEFLKSAAGDGARRRRLRCWEGPWALALAAGGALHGSLSLLRLAVPHHSFGKHSSVHLPW